MPLTPHIKARKSAGWVRNGIIYEIYPRAFSREGTLSAVRKKLPRLEKLGVTILWLMPFHPIGRKRRKGSLGSPYSVEDYYSVNAEYGTIEDVRSFVKAAHAHRMHVIMDLVIGHTAWDSVLMRRHPGWFKKSGRGKFTSPEPGWTDVAALDYSHQGLRNYMLELMRYWTVSVGFDGFRCDNAASVPLSFWEEARRTLDSIKPILLISETDDRPAHHRAAFDITYGSETFRTIENILRRSAPAESIHNLMEKEARRYPDGSLLMRFSTNHDQNVIKGADRNHLGEEGAKMAAVLVNTLPGVPLLYNGQEAGNRKRLSLFGKSSIRWDGGDGYFRLYRQLFQLRRKFRCLTHGKYLPLKTSQDPKVLAFARVHGSEAVIVLLNFSRKPLSFSIDHSALGIAGRRTRSLTVISPLHHAPLSVERDPMPWTLSGLGWMLLQVRSAKPRERPTLPSHRS